MNAPEPESGPRRVPAGRRVNRPGPGRLLDQVVARIAGLIAGHDLQPGARLPQTNQLAQMFGVSRTVVREALSVLSGRGLVEVKHGIGVFVARPPSTPMLDPALFQQAYAAEARHVLEVRLAVEVVAAGLAAERATSDDLQVLDAALERLSTAPAGSDATATAVTEFHRALARATQNPVFESIVAALAGALWHQPRSPVSTGTARDPYDLHDSNEATESCERIRAAVRDHSPLAARQAMRDHLALLERNLEWTEGVRRMRDAHLPQPSGI